MGPVLVIGAGGNLGRSFCRVLEARKAAFRALDLPEFDALDAAQVEAAIVAGVELVVNCAAYTDVDGAEADEPAALRLNADAPEGLASRAAKVGARYVDFSTDYVFDGQATEPYATDLPRAPLNAYGRTKAEGEKRILAAGGRPLILRTSWIYAPWGKNFVRTIAGAARSRDSLDVVDDQRGRPTSAPYLASRALALVDAGVTGIRHVTDGGECTWFEFASAIVSGLGIECEVRPCTSDRFPRPAPRPAYSVLDLSETESVIGPSRDWRENLADVLRELDQHDA